jgi:hypothetical protein
MKNTRTLYDVHGQNMGNEEILINYILTLLAVFFFFLTNFSYVQYSTSYVLLNYLPGPQYLYSFAGLLITQYLKEYLFGWIYN